MVQDGYKIIVFNNVPLQLKVLDKNDFCEIFLNYKGYNLASTMMFWEFDKDCSDANISFETAVEVPKNSDTMYFKIKKEDVEDFINEIYFFIMENDMDTVCTEEKKCKKKR